MPETIALIDDDRHFLGTLVEPLEAEGFRVRTFTSGYDALSGLVISPPDLAIVDLKMPGLDGIGLIKQLRQKTDADISIIVLSGKADDLDQIDVLRLDVDDFLTKPIGLEVLAERIRAVLRRRNGVASAAVPGAGNEVIARGNLVLDPLRHICTWRDREVRPTVTEFRILMALARRPGMTKGREELIGAAYGWNVDVSDRTIDSHIRRLRSKFREVDSGFDRIRTLYGIGYQYRDD